MLTYPLTVAALVTDRAEKAAQQVVVNHTPALHAAAVIRLLADAEHAPYPQYRGHWDGASWVLVQIRRTVTTKAGVCFEQGDIALARKNYTIGLGESSWTAYSVRTGCDVGLRGWDVAALSEKA